VIAEAHKITSQYLRAASSVDTEVAGAALRVAAENGNEALYHEFVAAIDTAKTPQEHDRFMFGLANFTDPELVKTTLEYAVSGKVRNQNSADLIARVLGNVRNRDAAWRFVTSNWNRIVAQTTMSSGGGIVGASGSFCEASKADEVKEFFTTHTVASSERTLRQTLVEEGAAPVRGGLAPANDEQVRLGRHLELVIPEPRGRDDDAIGVLARLLDVVGRVVARAMSVQRALQHPGHMVRPDHGAVERGKIVGHSHVHLLTLSKLESGCAGSPNAP